MVLNSAHSLLPETGPHHTVCAGDISSQHLALKRVHMIVNPFPVMERLLEHSAPKTNKDGYFYLISRVLS